MSSPSFLPLSLFVCLLSLYITHLSNGSDSITPAQSLRGMQTITSKVGRFELGLFAPSRSSQNYYVGIWYKQIPERTVVWVANRETPLTNTTISVLKISDHGNLVLLLSPSSVPIWSTNLTSTAPSNSTAAVLLDSGNLVLRDETNPSVIHWQSFDHPTDTFLPGNWIGVNKITGEIKRITSWKNEEDPAPGWFSFGVDPDQNQFLMLRNGTQRYWSGGLQDGGDIRGIVGVGSGFRTSFGFVDNQTGKYFSYYLHDPSSFLRTVMDASGQMKQFFWVEGSNKWSLYWFEPIYQCDVHALCGAFGGCKEQTNLSSFCTCFPGFIPKVEKDWDLGSCSDGCVRRTPLKLAGNSTSDVERDRFLLLPAMKLPDNSESLPVESAGECKLACLNNRSCTAYAFESRCVIWNGDLVNLRQPSDGDGDVNGRTLFLRLAASEVPISKSRKGMMAGIIVGSAVGLAFALGIVLFLTRRCQSQRKKVLMAAVTRGTLVAFSYWNLQRVTKNFSEKLGAGSFGSVFKGTLPDLTTVAVKRLEGLHQGEKQFRAEISTIGTIQHVNLIRLRGFCSEVNNKLLVYDYMPNGSLNFHLFGTAKCLDWSRRYQIAIETARGLAYLHEKCRECIIHCDIKPENILLDGAFSVKIADFGLAKLFGREFSHVLTTLRGTVGYVAPEWISGLTITPKADVYSYGMMLFEIISGRRNRNKSVRGPTRFYPTWAMRKMSEGDVGCVLDDRLEGNADIEELHRACKVAGWCIQDNEKDRPPMGQVVQILEGLLEVSVPPMPRLLQVLDENHAT